MNRGILTLIFVLGIVASAMSQTASGPNESSRLTAAGGNSYVFSWWGRSGSSYFIKQSDDLSVWHYLPVIETGQDGIISYGFTSTANRFFLRLVIEADPYHTDSDGDGIPDAFEVAYGLNPDDPTDASQSPDGDGMTNLQKYQTGTAPGKKDNPAVKLQVTAIAR